MQACWAYGRAALLVRVLQDKSQGGKGEPARVSSASSPQHGELCSLLRQRLCSACSRTC